jgi:hypothetical protein
MLNDGSPLHPTPPIRRPAPARGSSLTFGKMKTLLLGLVLVSSAIAADIHVFMWQESRHEKTGERQFGFYVASEAVKAAFEAEARGDDAEAGKLAQKIPSDAWMYGVLLQGEAKSYPREKVTMFRGHDLIEVVSGQIAVDVKKRVVEISLEIRVDGKVVPFPGNGAFTFVERPKQ